MPPFSMVLGKLEVERLGLTEFGGVLDPYEELRVEEDLAEGMPLEPAVDSLDEPSVLKLAFERRRRSLKNGMSPTMAQSSAPRIMRWIVLEMWSEVVSDDPDWHRIRRQACSSECRSFGL